MSGKKIDLQMQEIAGRLKEHNIEIELTDAAREWLAKEGFDPQFGARPLRRMLQRKVESPLSRACSKSCLRRAIA